MRWSLKVLTIFACLIALTGQARALGEVSVTDPNLYWSKYTWVFSDSTYAQSPTTGSYIKVAFSGDTIGLNLDLSPLALPDPDVVPTKIRITAYIDGSPTPVVKTLGDVSGNQLIIKDDLSTGNHYAQIYISANSDYTNRWNSGPGAIVRITSLQLDTAGGGTTRSLASTPLSPKPAKIIYYGDSITDGNGIGTTYAEDSHAAALARKLGVEYGQKGYAAAAWGATFISGTPAFYNEGSYNEIWSNYYNSKSLLTGGVESGGFSDGTPDAIFNNFGINDVGAGTGSAAMRTKIAAWLENTRTALGARPAIFMVVPFNYYGGTATQNEYKAAYFAGIADYKAVFPSDNRVFTIDLGTNGYDVVVANSSDSLHPNPTGSQLLAELIAAQAKDQIILDAPLTVNGVSEAMTLGPYPTFSGTAPAQSTITVTANSNPVTCVTTVDSEGNWSCTFTDPIEGGTHTISISAETTWGTTLNYGSFTVYISALASTGFSLLELMAGATVASVTVLVLHSKRVKLIRL